MVLHGFIPIQHIEAEKKMTDILQFAELCTQASTWHKVIAGLCDDLAPNRRQVIIWTNYRADSRFAPSQWETSLQFGNAVSHWLGTNRESWALNDGLVHWRMYASPGLEELTHWGRDNMAAISQTTLSKAFSWMKMLEFRLRFHWSLFLRVQLTIYQHWFR